MKKGFALGKPSERRKRSRSWTMRPHGTSFFEIMLFAFRANESLWRQNSYHIDEKT